MSFPQKRISIIVIVGIIIAVVACFTIFVVTNHTNKLQISDYGTVEIDKNTATFTLGTDENGKWVVSGRGNGLTVMQNASDDSTEQKIIFTADQKDIGEIEADIEYYPDFQKDISEETSLHKIAASIKSNNGEITECKISDDNGKETNWNK